MVKLSNIFGMNLWYTSLTQMLNEKYKFLIFKVIKSWVVSKYTAQQTFKQQRKRDTIKKHYKPYMAKKKTIYHGTQGMKNKVLTRAIDLTGINKVPIVG